MNSNETPANDTQARHKEPKDLQEANANIRKAEGDELVADQVDPKKAGNKPAIDRGR